jgi:hypothetical protein
MIYDNLEIDYNFLDMIENAIEEIDDNLIVKPTMKRVEQLFEEVNFQVKEVA